MATSVGSVPATGDTRRAFHHDLGKYRPVINCRMRGNSPPYCPVCYTEMKSKHHLASSHTFAKVYTGDFTGDGKDDILIPSENSILIYHSEGTAPTPPCGTCSGA